MRLTIENKSKQDIFVAIFQLLKNWSTCINICFDKDKLYIQSIDKSHVCLAYINIKSNWFSNYECINAAKVTVDAQYFAVLMKKHKFRHQSCVHNVTRRHLLAEIVSRGHYFVISSK